MQKLDPDTLAAWTALLVAHRRVTSCLDADLRRDAGMSLDDYDVLYQLRQAHSPIPMTELADRVLISRPTATRVVDRLVRHRWVERRHDDHDRRRVLVGLTADGRRAQTVAGRIHLGGITELVERPLQGHDVAAVTAALEALG